MTGPWGLLLGAWVMWLFIGAYAITPSSILSVVMSSFGIREAAAAWIITMPQVSATLVGLPIGMYLDRVDNRLAITGSTFVLAFAGVWGWLAGDAGAYYWLLASRLVGGITLVTLWTATTNVLSNAFPVSQRATAIGVFSTGYPTGYAFGQFAGPMVATRLPWAATFAVFGVGTLLGYAIFAFAGRKLTIDRGAGSTPELADFKAVLTNPGVWGVCALSFFVYMLYMVFNGWMPTYMAQTFDLSLTRSGLFTAIFPAIGLLSRPLGGAISDRLFEQRRRPVVLVSFLGSGVAVVGLYYSATVALLLGSLVVAGFFIQLQIGLLYTYVQEFIAPNVAGTAIAIVSVVGWGPRSWDPSPWAR
ncbi:MFS transporter [Haloarculaceae archaeon H-GB2-1]|nr:MFS transporter [Haloarculaceae archaeon H-GB2-1]